MPHDPDRARRLLGVTAEATPTEIRAAYRELMRRHHPDVANADPTANRRAAEISAAYAVLTGSGTLPVDSDTTTPHPPPPDEPPNTAIRADGAIIVEAPGNETFLRVHDALETIGDVTYRDRSGGYLQAIVQPTDGPLCTMVVAVETRSIDSIVYLSIDAMDSSDAPPIEPILDEIARLIGES